MGVADSPHADFKSSAGNNHEFVIKSHAIPTFCDQCSQVLTVQGIQCKSRRFYFSSLYFLSLSLFLF